MPMVDGKECLLSALAGVARQVGVGYRISGQSVHGYALPRSSKKLLGNWPEALKQLGSAEKERDLHRGRLRRVGPVNAIAFDALREALANGAFGRIRRIGGAHGVSPFLDRVRS